MDCTAFARVLLLSSGQVYGHGTKLYSRAPTCVHLCRYSAQIQRCRTPSSSSSMQARQQQKLSALTCLLGRRVGAVADSCATWWLASTVNVLQLLIVALGLPFCMLLHCSSHIACLRFGAAGSSVSCQG